MLGDVEVGKFRAFGFAVLRGVMSATELEQLNVAYERIMAKAPTFNYFGNSGSKYIKNTHEEDIAVASLCVHPRILEVMNDIWGRPCVLTNGNDMWLNLDETPWHSDCAVGYHIPSLQLGVYLDETTAEQGSLRVIPGTHHPEFNRAMFANFGYFEEESRGRVRLDPSTTPGAVAIPTQPGDIVMFDNRMYHAAFKRKDGRGRRNLFLNYWPDPQDSIVARAHLIQLAGSAITEKRPYLYSKRLLSFRLPAIDAMVERFKELGIQQVCEGAPAVKN